MKKKTVSTEKIRAGEFSLSDLKKDILAEARALNIKVGFAETIAEKTVLAVKNFLSKHPVVTKTEVEKIVVQELTKFDKDLAYIYHNRDKII